MRCRFRKNNNLCPEVGYGKNSYLYKVQANHNFDECLASCKHTRSSLAYYEATGETSAARPQWASPNPAPPLTPR